MQKKNAEEILKVMIEQLLLSMDELIDCKDREDEQFQYGERVAYTECLEWIQEWEKAGEYGLGFNVEEVYPL